MNPIASGTLTLVFTDVEGSTRLLEHSGSRYDEILEKHRSVLRKAFQSSGGSEIETEGDSFFVVFARAFDAIKAAVQAQVELESMQWPGPPLRVRIGIHTGDVDVGPSGFIGLAVHQAQRLCSAAHGGQILISGATKQVVEHSLSAEVSLKDLGNHRLKDLGLPLQLFQVVSPGLAEDMPAPRTLESLRHNLPVQLTSFVGREHELFELRQIVGSDRHVTICGPGGVGKTRIALQVAAEHTQDFPDGLWWVDLSSSSDPNLTSTISRALGVRDDASKPDPHSVAVTDQDPQLGRLIAHLSAARSLLILDNCEHLIERVSEVCQAILQGCPAVHIMTTSREPLGIAGELIWRPSPLRLPPVLDDDPTSYDSVRLFYERARLKVPAFSTTSEEALVAAEICRTLDGLPLAIELAAPLVTSLSLQQILDRLKDRFRLLRATDRSGAPTRQQALSATLDWSFDLLPEPERELFARLWVFKGDFALEVTEQVCSGGAVRQDEVFQLLSRLVEKSLVNREGRNGIVRFRLLETIREYSREKFDPGQDLQPSASDSFVFTKDGEVWAIGAGSLVVRMRDSKGMRHLHRLISSPSREFNALDLADAGVIQSDTGEVIDLEAKRIYRKRMEELQLQIEEAEDTNDIERASKAREEFDALADHLSAAFGLGGRSRASGSTGERARVSTTKAIRSAIQRIEEQLPLVGEHLQKAISTGNYCLYQPDPDVKWTL